MSATSPGSCASCGSRLSGPWCSACGERARKPGEVTLGEYLAEFIEAMTNLEGRFWGTLRALLFRPGKLTTEYLAGRRVFWMRPLHLFLVINLLYFLLSTWNTFSTPLWVHLNMKSPYQDIASGMVNRQLNEPVLAASDWEHVRWRMHSNIDNVDVELRPAQQQLQEFARQFDRNVELYSRTLIILLVPLITLVPLMISLYRRDGPVRPLVFGTHLTSFYVLISLPIGLLTSITIERNLMGMNPDLAEPVFSTALLLLLIAWLAPAYRRVYGLAWYFSLPASLLTILWLFAVLQIYRLILFFLVFWTMS